MFAELRGGLWFNLDPCQGWHAVEHNRDGRRVRRSAIVIDERFLRNRRAIEVRGDHEDSISTRVSSSFNISNRPASAFLTGAHNETQLRWRFRPGSFNYLPACALIEVDAFSGGTKHHITSDTRLIPLANVRLESTDVNLFVACERSCDWKEDASQVCFGDVIQRGDYTTMN